MSDEGRTDFVRWLLVELEMDNRPAVSGTARSMTELLCLSQLEATALLILVLSAARCFEWDEPLMELAHRMAGAISGYLEDQ